MGAKRRSHLNPPGVAEKSQEKEYGRVFQVKRSEYKDKEITRICRGSGMTSFDKVKPQVCVGEVF